MFSAKAKKSHALVIEHADRCVIVITHIVDVR